MFPGKKKPALRQVFLLVGATGFEPATFWSQTRRSSQAELRPEAGEEYVEVFGRV